jgi:hypothetical protein
MRIFDLRLPGAVVAILATTFAGDRVAANITAMAPVMRPAEPVDGQVLFLPRF